MPEKHIENLNSSAEKIQRKEQKQNGEKNRCMDNINGKQKIQKQIEKKLSGGYAKVN